MTLRGILRRADVRALTVVVSAVLLAGGCVERTVTPVDPLADIKGTWKGTRHQLVFDQLGAVVPDTTVTTDLTIVVGDNALTFSDSEAGYLPATVSSQSAQAVAFTLTDGVTTWTETCERHDRVLNGEERLSASGELAGVWAVTKQ